MEKIDILKNYIKKGFTDVEILALELELDKDYIENIIKSINQNNELKENTITDNKNKLITTDYVIASKKNESISRPAIKRKSRVGKESDSNKMRLMREKYFELFSKDYSPKKKNDENKSATVEEIELIDSKITQIESIIDRVKGETRDNRRAAANKVLEHINKIKGLSFSLEQADKLYILLKAPELENIEIRKTDTIKEKVRQAIKVVESKIIQAAEIKLANTDNIEDLKRISKTTSKISGAMLIGIKIQNKFTELNKKNRNLFSIELSEIAKSLSKGEYNIDEVNKIIEEEARKRVESREKTRFTLTEDGEKKKIINEIISQIGNNPNGIYNIVNPEKTFIKLNEINGDNREESIRIIISNLISTNRIEEAKSFFDAIYRSESNIDIKRNITGLLKKIRSAEIGDLVVRAIKARSTEKDDAQFYREIKKGIEQKSLSLETIELGRSRDGLKKISLSDVWPEKRELKR